MNNFEKSLKFRGALLGLRQFLATESPEKMMKNTFYFSLKPLFVLKVLWTCLATSIKNDNANLQKL